MNILKHILICIFLIIISTIFIKWNESTSSHSKQKKRPLSHPQNASKVTKSEPRSLPASTQSNFASPLDYQTKPEGFILKLAELTDSNLSLAEKKIQLEELVRAWAHHFPEHAITYLKEHPIMPIQLRFEAEQAFYHEIAQTQPNLITKELMQIHESDDQRRLYLPEYIASIATGWAKNDPESAFEWLNDLDLKEGVQALPAYFKDLTKANPDLAYEQINNLSPEKQQHAIKGMSSEWGNSLPEWDQIKQQINALPADLQSAASLHALIPYSQNNPKHAMQLTKKLPLNEAKNQLVSTIIDTLENYDNKKLLKWASTNTTPNYSSHITNTILDPWIEEDSAQAFQWLTKQPINKHTTQYINAYIESPFSTNKEQKALKDRLNSN